MIVRERGRTSTRAGTGGDRPLRHRSGPWKRGPCSRRLALLLGLIMLLHARITDRGGLGNLVETFLPWFGLVIPVLLAGALRRRSARRRRSRCCCRSGCG